MSILPLRPARAAIPCPPRRGFTLLELLVAMAIFSIMAAAAYSGLRSVLFTHAAVDSEARRLARLQTGFYLLEQDISQILAREVRDEFGQPQPALESGGLDGSLLTLTRTGWDNPLGQPRASLQRLAYRLEQDKLFRLHWSTLDRSGLSEPRRTLLLDGVEAVRIRFLDDEDKWQENWPVAQTREETTVPLPRAMEVAVTLNDRGEITRLFILPGEL